MSSGIIKSNQEESNSFSLFLVPFPRDVLIKSGDVRLQSAGEEVQRCGGNFHVGRFCLSLTDKTM